MLNWFRMAAMLKGNRVAATSDGAIPLDTLRDTGVRSAADVDALATRADREAAVMLWNYHDAEQTAAPTHTEVMLAGFPKGVHRVRLQHFRIDATHSNAYTVWQGMGSPQHPTTAQQAQLESAGGLQMLVLPTSMKVANGTLTLPIDLPRESVSLLHFSW